MLSLLSWNIHRCIGTEGEYRPDRIRTVLRELNADVIALQEVEQFRHDPGLLTYLCEDSDWSALAGVTLERSSGAYGNALLCRFPIRSVRRIDISVGKQEPRGVLDLVCTPPGPPGVKSIRVMATHLGLGLLERRRQLKALQALVDDPPETHEGDATVLMGDLNEWVPGSRELRRLRRRFEPAARLKTYPSHRPWFALDRILVRGIGAPGVRRAVNTAATRQASDHLPLLVEF